MPHDIKTPATTRTTSWARRRWARLLAATAVCLGALAAQAAAPSDTPAGAALVFDDLTGFAQALAAIDGGTAPATAMADYIAKASPGMQIFTARFGVTAESMAERLATRPRYYRYLASLRPEIEARAPAMRAALSRLQAAAPPSSVAVPVYFLIANMRAGGNPGVVKTPQGPRQVIGIAVDLMANTARVDMSEFPNGPAGIGLDDLAYTVVHEMAHVYQAQAQGLDAYRAMYADRSRGTHLAFAVREGCADFLTWQASGLELRERQAYVNAHERALWAEFAPVLRQPVDPAVGWFGPRKGQWPMQVGYGVGRAICETFYETAVDKAEALRQIYQASQPEHFDAIVAPYEARMARMARP